MDRFPAELRGSRGVVSVGVLDGADMRRSCLKPAPHTVHHDDPDWGPLLEVVGEELTVGFMWTHVEERADGTRIHAYKHRSTRRYLYLDQLGGAYEYTPCEILMPTRLDYAIQDALCTWWLLGDSTDADRDLIAVTIERVRANART